MVGPFGEALMRYSRVRAPGQGAQLGGMRAPNADALRLATPAPGAIKPSEAASEASLPPEIKAYLGMMTGGGAGPMALPELPPVPEVQPGVEPVMQPGMEPGVEPVLTEMPVRPPTIPVAMRVRAPRPPDIDIQTLAITAPDQTWQAAFYDRNGRRPNPSDYEMRYFAAESIKRTGALPTKAEWIFLRSRNFDQEPGGVSELA